MTDPAAETLKYPIGKYHPPLTVELATREAWIRSIENLPKQFSSVVNGLNDEQLDTPYRPGGWTVRQLVHHVADSHMNSQLRFRWALTEDVPLIKPYNEALWAELPDARSLPILTSLDLLAALHNRWTALLRQMPATGFQRKLRHPESGEHTLDWMLGLYAWHGAHHTAHISRLRERMSW